MKWYQSEELGWAVIVLLLILIIVGSIFAIGAHKRNTVKYLVDTGVSPVVAMCAVTGDMSIARTVLCLEEIHR